LAINANGNNAVTVTAKDAAGNASAPVIQNLVLGAVNVVTISLKLKSDTGSSSSDFVTKNGTIDVEGLTQGSRWSYTTDAGITWLQGTGNQFKLADGTFAANAIQVRQTDNAGNFSGFGKIASAVTIDTFAPQFQGFYQVFGSLSETYSSAGSKTAGQLVWGDRVYTDAHPIVMKFDAQLPADQLSYLMSYGSNSRYSYKVDDQGQVLLQLSSEYKPVHAQYDNFYNPTDPILVIPGNLTDLAGNVFSTTVTQRTIFFDSVLEVNPSTQSIFNLGLSSQSIITTLDLVGASSVKGVISGTASQWATLANKSVQSHISKLVPVVTELASGTGALPEFTDAIGTSGYGFELTDKDVQTLFSNKTWDVWSEHLQYSRFLRVDGTEGRMVFGQDGINDTLDGSAGQKVLVGGYSGTDTFVFDHARITANNAFVSNVIADFAQERNAQGLAFDKIRLDFAGQGQSSLRGNGTVYQELIAGDSLDVNAGMVLMKTHQADLSAATARNIAQSLKGTSNGDSFYLIFDNGTDASLYFMADTDNNISNGMETAQKISTLYALSNAKDWLSDLNFPGFQAVVVA
jgi:hypothetical protein